MASWTRYPSLLGSLEADDAAGLEAYCLLGRIGDFEAAEGVWKNGLSDSSFLNAISYLDNVLRQSRYGTAIDFLECFDLLKLNAEERVSQMRVISIIRAYLNVWSRGRLRAGLIETRKTLQWLSETAQDDYGDYHIHAVELCIHILKFAQNQSTYTTEKDLLFPSRAEGGTSQPWAGYEDWASHLAQKGRFWEAINIVKILASTMQPQWSIDAYERIDKLLHHAQYSPQVRLSGLALSLALGRRYTAAMNLERATKHLGEARTLLGQVEDGVDKTCSRQRLELEMATLELQPSVTDVSASLQQWHRLAMVAQERQEWGIESTCLTTCAQTASSNRMRIPLMQYLERLYIIEKDLERDMVSVVSNKCGSWLAGARSNLGELLKWFDQHEKEYPVSDVWSENISEGKLQDWDIPWSAARVAQLRYLMYSALQDPERAKAAKMSADHIMQFVPFERMSEMGLLDKYLLEWFNPLSGEPVTPFEVLCRRMRSHYSAVTTKDQSDWYRFRELESSELRNVVLCLPFDHEVFMHRTRSLQQWFATDDKLDKRSSDYLIARLYLEHYTHAKTTAQSQQIKEKIVAIIGDFLTTIPQGSLEVRRQLQGNLLLALQEQYDAALGRPAQPPTPDLHSLRSSYVDLISRYQSSHLDDNLPAIGSLYGRIAEIDFKLAFSEAQLEGAMQTLKTSFGYYDDYRTSLSSLQSMAALEIKGYVRQTIVGDQEVLHRALSVLMTKWLQSNIPETTKNAIPSLVWDLVQRNKNRALGDALSAKSVLSAADRAMLDADATSRECFERWQGALESLSLATQDRNCEASRLSQLRETLRAEERKMLADQICAKIIAFSRGTPPSTTDIGKLFAGSNDRVIVVDWFTADVPIATDKLFMLTVDVAPNLQSPKIFQLEPWIAQKVLKWVQTYILGANAAANRQSPASYNDLKSLAGLVQPLAEVSRPNDIIVFCPTTKWNLHRIPLHAIELRSAETGKDVAKASRDNLLFLRNRIVYTYSQSLLRISAVTRQADTSSGAAWTATLLSPLKSQDVERRMTDLADFLPRTDNRKALLTSTSVTKTASTQAMLHTSFLAFLGHVHTAPRAIKSHMLLYHPQSSAGCNPSTETDPETTLSDEGVITLTRLQLSAHAVLLACGSGVTEARVQDEALGLVPAFFHAGARSVVATLWDVRTSAACEWLQQVQNAWERAEQDLRRQEKARPNAPRRTMIDLAEIFRSAAKSLMQSDHFAGIDSWAPFVYSGYWMYPRVDVDVFDSDEEDE